MSISRLEGSGFSFLKWLGGSWLRRAYQRHLGNMFLRYAISYEEKCAQPEIFLTRDAGRKVSIFLAIRRLEQEKIAGAFAELGVYRGDLSKILHELAPARCLYLFDTFEGFHENDLKGQADNRFTDTSVDLVKERIGNLDNVVFRIGYFPETSRGLENERFAFVMLDVDKYEPTLAGLEFFYPRLSHSGYLFLHDYNSSESGGGVSRAVNEFMRNKPEKIIDLPDECGTVLFRKM